MESIQWAIDHGRYDPTAQQESYNRVKKVIVLPLWLCPVCNRVWDFTRVVRQHKTIRISRHYSSFPKYGLDKVACTACTRKTNGIVKERRLA